MKPFHCLFPELAQREVRCVHVGASNPQADQLLPPDEYVYVEFYCDDLKCDCRRVLLQVISKTNPDAALAWITFGWEKERFYRNLMPEDPEYVRATILGDLDPAMEQSELAEVFLHLFKTHVLDEPYRMRLRRHHRMFREEVARRAAAES
jgi:hypothetical protein